MTSNISTKRSRRKRPARQNLLNTPWNLHFDRDGTEDIAIICEADGSELVTSRHFWLPEGNDSVPATLSAVWLMKAAPKLLAALTAAERFIRGFEGDESQEGLDQLLSGIHAAIAETTGGRPA